MSDPIDKAVRGSVSYSFWVGLATAVVVYQLGLSFLWIVAMSVPSAALLAWIETRAKRKIYGHVYDAIRSQQGWV